jgi:hypothetical protein
LATRLIRLITQQDRVGQELQVPPCFLKLAQSKKHINAQMATAIEKTEEQTRIIKKQKLYQ